MTNKVYKLCDLWWEKSEEVLRSAVERQLQETLLNFPWLVDSLNPVATDFLLSTLHLHSPTQATHQPGQPVDSQPDMPAPSSTRKRCSGNPAVVRSQIPRHLYSRLLRIIFHFPHHLFLCLQWMVTLL